MTDRVPASKIERTVGTARYTTRHIGRAVSADQRVYILHPQVCLDSGIDLRDCPFSIALDRGINKWVWARYQDRPVELRISPEYGDLLPGQELEP